MFASITDILDFRKLSRNALQLRVIHVSQREQGNKIKLPTLANIHYAKTIPNVVDLTIPTPEYCDIAKLLSHLNRIVCLDADSDKICLLPRHTMFTNVICKSLDHIQGFHIKELHVFENLSSNTRGLKVTNVSMYKDVSDVSWLRCFDKIDIISAHPSAMEQIPAEEFCRLGVGKVTLICSRNTCIENIMTANSIVHLFVFPEKNCDLVYKTHSLSITFCSMDGGKTDAMMAIKKMVDRNKRTPWSI